MRANQPKENCKVLKIYHMPGSRSTRVVFAAEELQIPHTVEVRRRSQLKHPEILAVNPFGAAPIIEDGSLKMMESMAIVEYLVERHDSGQRLAPAIGSPLRPAYLQWLHYAEGSLAPPVIDYLWASGQWDTTPLDVKARDDARFRVDIAVGFIDDVLAHSPYIVGEQFTAADIGIFWVIFLARFLSAVDFDEMQNVAAYMTRVGERPAAKKALTFPPNWVLEPPGSVQTPGRQRKIA
jgi:glutathione S-transferase